jgi:hypothetical protein
MYIVVLLVLPPDVQSSLEVEVLGVEVRNLHVFPSLLTLGLAVVIAHLCSVLAHSARLARVHSQDPDLVFSASEKLQIEVVTEDGFDETSLFMPDSKCLWLYYVARVTGFSIMEDPMKGKRFTEEQIIRILQEAESGLAVADVCRKHNCSEQSFAAR